MHNDTSVNAYNRLDEVAGRDVAKEATGLISL
jgi:hypothetical protein